MAERLWRIVGIEEMDESGRYVNASWLPDELVLKWQISRDELKRRMLAEHFRWSPETVRSPEKVARIDPYLEWKTKRIWDCGLVLDNWGEGCDIAEAYLVVCVSGDEDGYEWAAYNAFDTISHLTVLDLIKKLGPFRELLELEYPDDPNAERLDGDLL